METGEPSALWGRCQGQVRPRESDVCIETQKMGMGDWGGREVPALRQWQVEADMGSRLLGGLDEGFGLGA